MAIDHQPQIMKKRAKASICSHSFILKSSGSYIPKYLWDNSRLAQRQAGSKSEARARNMKYCSVIILGAIINLMGANENEPSFRNDNNVTQQGMITAKELEATLAITIVSTNKEALNVCCVCRPCGGR